MRTDTAKFTNTRVMEFGQSRYLVSEREMFIKNEVKISSRVFCVQ